MHRFDQLVMYSFSSSLDRSHEQQWSKRATGLQKVAKSWAVLALLRSINDDLLGLSLVHVVGAKLGGFYAARRTTRSTGFAQPKKSPNCVRSLDGRLEQQADIAVAETKHQNRFAAHLPIQSVSSSSWPTMAAADSSQEAKDSTVEINLRQSRNRIFGLIVLLGQASALFLDENDPELEPTGDATADEEVVAANKTRIAQVLARILIALVDCAKVMNVDLEKACHFKIDLNCQKYPVELCKGKTGKYTEYSTSTGITKTKGQWTACASTNVQQKSNDDDNDETKDWTATFLDHAVPAISLRARRFVVDRDWSKYHTSRNILLALLVELGELAELLQFKGDVGNATLSTSTEHNKICQELADVTIYLLRLAEITETAEIGLVAKGLQDQPS